MNCWMKLSIISEAKLPKKRLTDGIRLAGNLEMDGTIKASAFYLSAGSQMETQHIFCHHFDVG
mgnify:CR=1 FL=1